MSDTSGKPEEHERQQPQTPGTTTTAVGDAKKDVVVTKRGRGRPRKYAKDGPVSTTMTPASVPPPPPSLLDHQPPQNDEPVVDVVGVESSLQAKRKRGRPKKNLAGGSGGPVTVNGEGVVLVTTSEMKRRGRAAKKALVADDTDGEGPASGESPAKRQRTSSSGSGRKKRVQVADVSCQFPEPVVASDTTPATTTALPVSDSTSSSLAPV